MNDILPEKIIKEIEDHNLVPKPKWKINLKRVVLWSLAGFATILGGVAVSIIIFVFIDYDPTAHEYLNQSAFKDILLTIPYLWFVVLVALTIVAKYSFRHIKFGYRYATFKVVGLVLGASIITGLALNAVDAGERIDDFLDDVVPYYNQLVYTSKDAWSQPEKGFLGGTVIGGVNGQEFEILDFHRTIWRINIGDLENDNVELIKRGVKIKVIGVEGGGNSFRAQHIFLWD
jgi:hypothetical protein